MAKRVPNSGSSRSSSRRCGPKSGNTPPGQPDPSVQDPPLDEKHRRELQESGLTDKIIRASGIYSASDKEIANVLGWRPSDHAWGRGLIISYQAAEDDAAPSYARVKLDYPRHGRDGKPIKYESPRGAPNRAYFPPGFRKLFDRAPFITITEGEKRHWPSSRRRFPALV